MIVRSSLAAFGAVVLVLAAAASAAAAEKPAGSGPPAATRALLAESEPVTAEHAMVVTAQHLATRVGVDVLRDGGNAIDAAVAVGYALAVVHPCCGNLGGGGFLVAHLVADDARPAKNVFLNFREKAPAAATAGLFQNAAGQVVPGRSTKTYLGTGVPGTVMGLEKARRTYGTMSRARLMRPAIRLARDGFTLRAGGAKILQSRSDDFADKANVAAIFLHNGRAYRAGEVLKQPQLAHTLGLIKERGPDAFYNGPIAKAIVAASNAHGGILTRADLANYTAPWGKPVRCGYAGHTILSTPPPSSGGTTICEILGVLDPLPLANWGYGATRTSHYLIEAERRAFADRNTYLGDPAFIDNPIERLLSTQNLARLRASIQPQQATPSDAIKASLGPREGKHTTHYSIVDPAGNAVAVTYTINSWFGTGLIAGDTGFFLNDELDDFTAKPGVPNAYGLVQGKANAVGPGKRPLSSMSPSIVLEDGELFMVTGSPGGSTIISTTLETMINVIDFGMNMAAAVDAPRIHNQWRPEATWVEPGYLSDDVRAALQAMGHRFTLKSPWGAAEAIRRDPESGALEGANDRRRDAGLAAGF